MLNSIINIKRFLLTLCDSHIVLTHYMLLIIYYEKHNIKWMYNINISYIFLYFICLLYIILDNSIITVLTDTLIYWYTWTFGVRHDTNKW